MWVYRVTRIKEEGGGCMPTDEEMHNTLLRFRARYTLQIPTYDNGVRTSATRLAFGEYTGDVVEELWCGVKFRQHRYWTLETRRGNSNMGDQRRNTYSEAFYETTLIAHDASQFPVAIPDQILNGEWTNPLMNQQKYIQTHRTGSRWGLYAEDYVDPFTRAKLQTCVDKDADLDKTRAVCLRDVSTLISDLHKLQRILLTEPGAIDYAGACENADQVEAQFEKRIANLQETLGTVKTMCESFKMFLSGVQETAQCGVDRAVAAERPEVMGIGMGALLSALGKCVE